MNPEPLGRPAGPPRSIGLVVARHRQQALAAARHACSWLAERGLERVADPDAAALLGCDAGDPRRDADIIIAFGGDGTVVSTARAASGHRRPVIGVNFGTFGFLAEIQADRLCEGLEAVVAGRYCVEHRLMLQAEATVAGQVRQGSVAANDVVAKGHEPNHVLEMLIHVNGELVAEFPGDGVILSTPTGSTAYNLSAGGPVIDPRLNVYALTPICPHTLATRPIVLSGDAEVQVEIVQNVRRAQAAVVSVDGQVNFDLEPAGRLVVRQADASMLLARLPEHDFFHSLRDKLRWGQPK